MKALTRTLKALTLTVLMVPVLVFWLQFLPPSMAIAAAGSADALINLGMSPELANYISTKLISTNSAGNTQILLPDGKDFVVYEAGAGQFIVRDGALLPGTDDDVDIGSASLEFQDLFLDGTATIDALDNSGTSTLTGAVTAGATLGVTGDITGAGDLILSASGKTVSLQEATAGTKCMGTATANGTTAVTVSTTCATTGSRIFLSATSDGTGTAGNDQGACWATNIVNGTSFDLDCPDSANNAAYNWLILHESA